MAEYLLYRGAAADIEEVGGLASPVLDKVQGGHRQAGAVHQTANVPLHLDVAQIELTGPDFLRLFLIQIAVSLQLRMAEERVSSKLSLASSASSLPSFVKTSGLISAIDASVWRKARESPRRREAAAVTSGLEIPSRRASSDPGEGGAPRRERKAP